MKKLTFLTAILLATTTFAQVPNYVPTNGLVGWWPFNGNANDESGNGNNGTVNGATLTSDRNGIANKAYSFDGVNDYIQAFNPLGNLTSDFTISSFANISTWQGGLFLHVGIDQNSFPRDGFGYGYGGAQAILSGQNYIGLLSNVSWYQSGFQFNNLSSWYNVVVTRSSNTLKYFVDGILVGNNTISSIEPPSNALFFGSGAELYANFNGKLDDIGIWNRALTDCEIKDLYNSQLGSSNTTSSQTQTALDTYTWPVNNQTYTQSGTYSDTLINAAGCDSIVTLNLTLSYTGINELNASQLVVSPNPTKDNFSISGLELLGTITSLEIKDAAGKVLKVLNPTTTNFSCVGLKAGVYFLAVYSNKTERVIKIIKE